MDPHHLQRLQEEQKRAIYETDAKIGQLKKFQDDYRALQERLQTLPDKVTHDIMVPFGKLAFMPGRIVHTNEILVLLGDNWFAERSAKQAAEIAGRRMQGLDEKLKDLEDQRKLLTPRLDFTTDLKAELEGQGSVQEIVEEYDEEKERLWDEQHRKNVKRYKERLMQENRNSQPKSTRKEEALQDRDSALWSRLDELERLEAERGEMDSEASEEENGNNNHEKENTSKASARHKHRRVSWADEKIIAESRIKEEIDSDDMDESDTTESDYEDEEEEDDESEDVTRPVRLSQRTIYFKHSDTPAILPHQVSASGDSSIQSPADIYKMFCPKKSILKKPASSEVSDIETHPVSTEEKVAFCNVPQLDDNRKEAGVPELQAAARSSTNKAFTGLVVEKSTNLTGGAQQSVSESSSAIEPSASAVDPASSAKHITDGPPKRVSKFKASRSKQSSS